MNRSSTTVTGIARILVLVALNIFIISLVTYVISQKQDTTSIQTLSKLGSRGQEVTQIQTKLKELGLYSGSADGIYGEGTKESVKKFQQQKGLSVDGVAGPTTLKALGITTDTPASATGDFSESDYHLLARLISAESRGEPYIGQVAVGAVILNRVDHPSFPNSLPGVAYQPGAFTAITDGQIDQPIYDSAYRAAKEALGGSDPSAGALYYFNPDKTSNKWIRTRKVIKRIGEHLFCE